MAWEDNSRLYPKTSILEFNLQKRTKFD